MLKFGLLWNRAEIRLDDFARPVRAVDQAVLVVVDDDVTLEPINRLGYFLRESDVGDTRPPGS